MLLLDINPGDNVMDYLVAESILSQDEYDEIQGNTTTKKQAQCMLNIVPRKGRRAFAGFVEGLEQSESEGHRELAEQLRKDAREAGVPVGNSGTGRWLVQSIYRFK